MLKPNVKPRSSVPDSPAQALAYVTAQGARTRRHRYLHDLRMFALPVLTAIALQAVVYVLVATNPGRADWANISLATAILAFVPIFGAGLLTAFRRHEAALMSATLVTVTLFSISVSVLSAFRVPLSYMAILACAPPTVAIIAFANIRFNRTTQARVALAAFNGAKKVLEHIKRDIPLVHAHDTDLGGVDMMLVDPKAHHSEKWSRLLAQCYLAGVEIVPWTRYVELWHGRLDVASFDVTHIAYSPSQLLYARVKRSFDISLVLISIPITLPLAILTAIYIFIRDPGRTIFVQLRRGFGGRRFRMYKFRTMYTGVAGGATAEGDDRIIPGCNILRKLRLDELPQLYNILIGDMSLIGPRPESVELARWYEREIQKYTMRLLVLPGITGWAQVSHGYTSNPDEALEKLAYDLYYIKHLSLDLDILILFKTVNTVLFGRGAR